jgi:hypothetical protein
MSTTIIPTSKSKSKCSYCHSDGHNITSCPEDSDMDKLLDSSVEPNFHNLSLKTLKKIASLTGLRTSIPKPQLVNTFKRTWRVRNEERANKSSTLKKELTTNTKTNTNTKINNLDEQTDCPICMDELGVTDNCTTKCGHKFCSSCFVKSVMRKNNCPMCRAPLIDDEEYYWPIERYLGESYNENIATRNQLPTQFMTSIHEHQYQSQITSVGTFESYGELSSIDNNNISVTDLEMTIGQNSVTGLVDWTVDMDDIFGADSDEDIPSLIDELFPQEEETNDISNTTSLVVNTGMGVTTTSRNAHTIGVSTMR